MQISFTPSPDVAHVLKLIIDTLEKRTQNINHATRNNIKITFREISLPTYFSQTDPIPRLTANEQFSALQKANLLKLNWLPGETGNLLQSIVFETRTTQPETFYTLLNRTPISDARDKLDALIRAELFRYQQDDWRMRALKMILRKIRDGKSPAPFNLYDTNLNLGLLTALEASARTQTETPYRVFSVQTFNDSKRFETLKPAFVRLASLGNPTWKKLPEKELLQELNLVANPNYIHLAGNLELTTQNGEILSLCGFSPSVGFPAAQIETLHAATIHADALLCIENLTTFHEFIRSQENETRTPQPLDQAQGKHATLCLMGNPSPAIRQLLKLIPKETPIRLWADMDYGGFNILSILRREISPFIQPYCMDIDTFEKHTRLSRPLNQNDARNLRRLLQRRELQDVFPVIEHLLKSELKLEQEAISLV